MLSEVLNEIDEFENNDDIEMGCIFVFVGNESPISSPEQEEPFGNEGITKLTIKDSNSKKVSVKSSLSINSDQQRFLKFVLARDHSKCIICGEGDANNAAHIISVGSKVDNETLLREYQLDDVSDTSNGSNLCASCHNKYDNYIIGITPLGYIEEKKKNIWEINHSTCIFKSDEERTHKRYPSEKILKWKYDKFLKKKDPNIVKRLYKASVAFFWPKKYKQINK